MKLVGYLRVSGKKQLDGWGLDRQRAELTKWAKENGHKIVAWYTDPALSGTLDSLDRPGLTAAINEISGSVEGICMADIDRLARALTVQEAALALVWRREPRGHAFTLFGEILPDDPDDPARTLIRQVLGAVIEYDRKQIVKRLKGGRRAKAAAGMHAVGQYAYGYRGRGEGRERDAAPDPNEQIVVDRILNARKRGASYRSIAGELDAAGVPPRYARRWSAMTVRSVYLRHKPGDPSAKQGTNESPGV